MAAMRRFILVRVAPWLRVWVWILTLNDSANQVDECGMKERSHFA
jgi:hypothetical protein